MRDQEREEQREDQEGQEEEEPRWVLLERIELLENDREQLNSNLKVEEKRTNILWSMTICMFLIFAVLVSATALLWKAKGAVDDLRHTLVSDSFAYNLGDQFADGAITSLDPWLGEAVVRVAAEIDKDVDGEKSRSTKALERLRSFVREGDQGRGKPAEQKPSGDVEPPKEDNKEAEKIKEGKPKTEDAQEEKKASESPLSEDDLFKDIE